jgi:acyl-CoA synthetase (AMP-forming)/AMP-acid ligase II
MNGASHSRLGGNVCELLLRAAAGPDRPAIVEGSTTTSYGELAARALAFGERISAAGVAPGDRVGIWLRRNADAAVSSEPDEIRGQRIVAHVVLTDLGSVDDLKQFASRELPHYMQPSRIEVRSELPRTATGKHDITGLAGTEG